MWILAAKLPNSDLNFAVDFLVDFFLLFFPRNNARKNPLKNPPQNSLRTLVGKIPLGFLQKPFLEYLNNRHFTALSFLSPASKELRGDHDVVMHAVSFAGLALRYASEDPRKPVFFCCVIIQERKRHINRSFRDRGVSRPGGQGSKFYVLSSEPKEHKSFCPDTRPGGPVTRATGKSFMCKSFMCLFCSLIIGTRLWKRQNQNRLQ